MTLTISQPHRDARSLATINYADSSGSGSYIQLRDANNILLVTLLLAYPCGVIQGGSILLDQLSANGDQIVADGIATTGVWMKANGEVVAEGTVTDSTGSGDFKITSATGVNLYTGGYVLLGVTNLS